MEPSDTAVFDTRLGWAENLILSIIVTTQDIPGMTSELQEYIADGAVNTIRPFISSEMPETLLS